MRFLMGPIADKFDLHDYFDVVKINKNRKCASCSGGEHGFEKQLFDANSYQVPPSISFLLLARHWLVFFENHKNQVRDRFGAAGRNARGRWGEI